MKTLTAPPPGRWFRFGISHLLMVTLGIALGFAPLKLWELNARGEPQILAHIQVIELPRSELASLGTSPQSTSGASVPMTALDKSFAERLKALTIGKSAKVLAEPVLTTISGRPSKFNMGGEVPVPVETAEGLFTVEYREFGTSVSLLPTLLRNGRIHTKIDLEISTAEEVAQDDGTTLPTFRGNKCTTELDLASGETIVMCTSTPLTAQEENCVLILATMERVNPQ